MTRGRRLVVVRHAKAEPFASSDHARALTDRGVRDAKALGTYLREQGVVPDHAVVSTAERARGTWAAMQETLQSDADVEYDAAVYSGSTDVLLEQLRLTPPAAQVVVLVGHQPSVGYLAHLLDDGAGEHEALHSMLLGFRTSSAAVFDVAVAWDELDGESGRLVDFYAGST